MREHCEAGRALDADTPVVPASWEAGAARRRRRLRAGGRAAGRHRADRLLRAAPARPPRRARPRDGLLPVRQRRDRRRARAGARRRRPRVHPRLGRPPRQRHARRLPLARPTCCSAACTSGRSTPAPAPWATSARARGRGSRSTCPCPPGPASRSGWALVEHVVVPAAREFAPDLILVSAGFDAHRDDPLAECDLETDSFRQLALHVAALAAELGVPAGRCWRAATTWTRWPSPPWRRWRRWRRVARRVGRARWAALRSDAGG